MYPVHRRCSAYIEHLSPCLQNSNSWLLPSILRLIDREGVECEKHHALKEPVETAMKTTMSYEFDAFGANLQCCIFLRSPQGSSEFFFISKAMSIKSRTVWGFGLSGKNCGGPFERCADSENLVTMEVFGNVSTKRFSCCMVTAQQLVRAVQRWPGTFEDSSSNKAKPGQR